MSIASTTNRVDYTGNGAVDTYSYTFRIFVKTDLRVTVRDTDDAETTLTVDTHYTVSGVGDEGGGSVALVNGAFGWLDGDGDLKSNYKLTIRRVRPLTQTTDIRNQGDFFPETHEDAFDHFVMIQQQQQDEINRAVKLPESVATSVFSPALPADIGDSADKVPLVNGDGDGFADAADWPTADEIANAQASALAAAASATDSSEHATTASRWATKIDGSVVDADTSVDSGEYSSKAYAIGGTGVTSTSGKGAAKEWATKTSAAVDTSEYSAKEYAQGTQAATGGSAKDWAQKTSAAVTGSSYSAKEWALGTQTRGAASGGSSKDWANYTGGTVDNAEYSAKKYAVDAAASASTAASTLAAALWRGVVRISTADSPYTVLSANGGKLHVVDTTSGAVTINLPQLSGLTLPINFGFKLDAGANAVTIARAGSDTINGETSKVLAVGQAGVELIATTDGSPDDWETVEFGAAGGNLTVDRFSGDGSDTTFDLSVTPASENNTQVYVSGVYQQKDTYSLSGSTITFSSAPPVGTDNIEVVTGTTLSIGAPADATVTTAKIADANVTRAKLASGAVAKISVTASKTTTYTATTSDDMIPCDATGGAFTVTLPAVSGNSGVMFIIKKTDSSVNAVTIDGDGAETIDGSANTTLNTQHEAVHLVCDGTAWHIVHRKIDSTWKSDKTFTPNSFGTVTNNNWRYRRVGDSIELKGYFTAGTVTGSAASISLPSDIVIDSAKIGTAVNMPLGRGFEVIGTGAFLSGNVAPVAFFDGSDTGTLFLSIASATSTTFEKSAANTMQGNGGSMPFMSITFPVVGWKGN